MEKKDYKQSPKDTNGPVVKTGPTAGSNRSRNSDGRWRKKRSDAGKPRKQFEDNVMDIKTGLKKTLNFTFEKAIPTMLGALEKQIPKTIEKYEKHEKMTDEKIEELYDKADNFYGVIDKVYSANDFLNDKVNSSKFFNGEEIEEDEQ